MNTDSTVATRVRAMDDNAHGKTIAPAMQLHASPLPPIGSPAFLAWAQHSTISDHVANGLQLLALLVDADFRDPDASVVELIVALERRLHAVLELERMHAPARDLDACIPSTDLVEVVRHYGDGAVNDFEPIPDRYEKHAQFAVTSAGLDALVEGGVCTCQGEGDSCMVCRARGNSWRRARARG